MASIKHDRRVLPTTGRRCLLTATFWAAGLGWTPAAAQVIVQTVESVPLEGRVARFALRGEVVLRASDGNEKSVSSNDVVRIVLSGKRPTPPEAEACLTLSGGDRLFGRITGRGEDVVELESATFGSVQPSLDAVREIRLLRESSSAEARGDPLGASLLAPSDDRALLTNGDELRGLVLTVDERGVTLEGAHGPEVLPWTVVQSVRLGGTTNAHPRSGPLAVVRTVHDERLTCRELRWSDGIIEGEHVSGFRLSFPESRLASVEMVGGRWRWLGELEPVSFEHTPMLGIGWPYRVNRNVAGDPMLVDGWRYEHGIGVHSRSSLTFELRAQYLELVTAMGVDDRSGPLADVTAAILVDGVRAFSRSGLQAGELVGPIRVDVRRAGRVELIVDYGRNGDLQDRFNWIESGVVRKAVDPSENSPAASESRQDRK